MKNFHSSTFGELYAKEYDIAHNPGTTDLAVAFLREIAAGRKTLELAIGTGRISLPLSRLGLDIHGIDASPEMLAIMNAKSGGDAIPVHVGDMADVDIDGTFGLVFLVFNTLFNLPSQEAQCRCFENSARHLDPGGHFLIETFVPDVTQFARGQNLQTLHLDDQSVLLEAALHNPLKQTIDYQRITLSNQGIQLKPLPMRYAWPTELDLMAKLAGMHLKERWGSWDRAAFTADSKMHVSVYEKDEG